MCSEHARKDLPNHAESAEDTHSTQANKEACVPHISISRTPHGRTTGLRGLPLSLIQMGMGRYSFWIHTLSPPPDFGLTLSVVSAARNRFGKITEPFADRRLLCVVLVC